MTRAPRFEYAAPGAGRGYRFAPYTIPDLSLFRLRRQGRTGEDEPVVPVEPDEQSENDLPDPGEGTSSGPVNIPDWIDGTVRHSSEVPVELEDIDMAIRGYTPIDDALDVVRTMFDQPASSDGFGNDDVEESQEMAADGPDTLPVPDAEADDTTNPWIPDEEPDNVYAGSDASAFEELDGVGEEPPPFQPSYDNVREYRPDGLTMNATEFKFALFMSEFNLTRRAWRALCEIISTSPYHELAALPKWKPTLMKKFTKQLPKCSMRRKTIQLNPSKLPNRASDEEDLVWLDMEDYISKLLQSPLHMNNIYQGLAHLTRFATDFWHTRAWGESIRTTSGRFIHNANGDCVLPSDFVRFKCLRDGCWCYRVDEDPDGFLVPHLGRVTYCGVDKTGRFSDGHPIALIAPAFEPFDLPADTNMEYQLLTRSREFTPKNFGVMEAVLVQGQELLIPAENITEYVKNVMIDYDYDPKEEAVYTPSATDGYVIRYVWNKVQLQAPTTQPFISARLTSPHRAELEMQLKSRASWIHDLTSKPCVSLPWKMFIDAFGLYRNMYRSMTGVYPLPAFYPDAIANRRASVTPLTVGLYGMDTSDLLTELSQVNYLATGHNMNIGGTTTHVVSFTMCFIGDFPQQQELSGCKDHKALQPCRFCMIPKALRHDLDYNILEFGRYHEEITSIREKVKDMRVGQRQKTLKGLGLKEFPLVADAASALAPGLDLLRGRPIDAAHSEFTSLVKHAQRVLINEVIAKRYHNEFIKTFRRFPLPPRFHRIQSPTTHLDSWRMQECTEVSIVMPVLLYVWLTDSHINPNFMKAIKQQVFEDAEDKWLFVFADLEQGHIHERHFASDLSDPTPEYTPQSFPKERLKERRDAYSSREVIILLFWNIARSNLLVFGRYPPQLTNSSFSNIVYRGRKSLQLLFHLAAHSCAKTSRSSAISITGSNGDDGSAASVVTEMSRATLDTNIQDNSVVDVGRLSGKAKVLAYSRLKELPNIHQGIHLWDVAYQYGACRMVNTLLGEDKHKQNKTEVLTTNNKLVSETLIQRVNTRTSINFGFAGAFQNTYPRVHEYFNDIGADCPTLLQRLQIEENDDHDDENYGHTKVLGDESHSLPLVANTMKHAAVNDQADELLRVLEPNKLDLHCRFVRLFMDAYERDYKLLDVVNLGNKRLRWVGRLSFETATSKRICLRTNDYIRTTRDMRLARVDGIFTHHFHIGIERVFLVITFLLQQESQGIRDKVLDCQSYEIGGERQIIGLPSILPSEYWIVKNRDGFLLSLPHDIYTI